MTPGRSRGSITWEAVRNASSSPQTSGRSGPGVGPSHVRSPALQAGLRRAAFHLQAFRSAAVAGAGGFLPTQAPGLHPGAAASQPAAKHGPRAAFPCLRELGLDSANRDPPVVSSLDLNSTRKCSSADCNGKHMDRSTAQHLGAERWRLWGSSLPEHRALWTLEEPAQILGSAPAQAFSSSHFNPAAELLVSS